MTHSYSDGVLSHHHPTELTRLQALECAADAASWKALASVQLRAGDHVLDAGAGAGALARRLAATHPHVQVTATDLDTRFLDNHGCANLTITRHDLSRDDFPPRCFRLIHTRAVLVHIPDRDQTLHRMATWLAPGGTLLVEEPHLHVDDLRNHLLRRTLDAASQVISSQHGFDPVWATRLPELMRTAGLEQIVDIPVIWTPDEQEKWMRVLALSVDQLKYTLTQAGLLSDSEITEFLSLCTTGKLHETCLEMITIRGVKAADP
jgi:SAM-dependent methyltransferase